jgi:hypothetical protein
MEPGCDFGECIQSIPDIIKICKTGEIWEKKRIAGEENYFRITYVTNDITALML